LFLSIITVTKDDPDGLRRTIDSVDRQSFNDFEHIVINGTKDADRALQISLFSRDVRKFIFQRDSGIYDAMNIGLSCATGEYILFLNGGDELLDDALLTAEKHSSDKGKPDLLCFRQEFVSPDGRLLKVRAHYGPEECSYLIPFWHQALLIRTDFHRASKYDPNMSIAGDHDLFLRLLKRNPSIGYSDLVISRMFDGGIGQKSRDLANIESLESLLKNKVIRNRGEINNCHYFNSLFDRESLLAGYSSIGKRVHSFLQRVSGPKGYNGLIWGNSLIGRQIYAVSPHSFRGFVDLDRTKPGIPGVTTFSPSALNCSFDFIILSVNLEKSDVFATLASQGISNRRVYSIEDINELH
jgi:glycosyltransferase involved in cell wall biosynthesis